MNEAPLLNDELTSDNIRCVFTGLPITKFGGLKDVRKNGVDGVHTVFGPVHQAALRKQELLLNEVKEAIRKAIGISLLEAFPKKLSGMITRVGKRCVAENISVEEAIQGERDEIEAVIQNRGQQYKQKPLSVAPVNA
jgi:hypothetical protein